METEIEQDEPDLAESMRERYTGIALSKAEHMEDLINDFFEITRFNLTVMTLEKENFIDTRAYFEYNRSTNINTKKCTLLERRHNQMLAVKSVDVRNNFKEWCDKISKGETVLISRPQNKNIYMVSEAEYNDLQKTKRNAEYMEMIHESVSQLKRGETISLTEEELKAMEDEEWEPTEKILEFEKKYGIKRED